MNTKRPNNQQNPVDYSCLEPRLLLAATASIETVGGRQTLVIEGDQFADTAIVNDASNNRVRLTLNGQNSFFDKPDFVRIRFLGRSGNDFFENRTDIDSAAFGHSGNDVLIGGNGHNWMQGGDGNDTLTGGDRNDLLRGREGVDTIDGGRRHDRLFGTEGNDRIFGGPGNDFIRGDGGNDTIFGGNGNDNIGGGFGNDEISTGDGSDRIVYANNYSQYTVFGGNTLSLTDASGANGSDEVVGAETFAFNNVVHTATSVLTANRQVVIRPIVVSNSNGSNPAEFFGNDQQEEDTKLLIDEIFAQADIDVLWENERFWNNTFANVGNGNGPRPSSDLQAIVQNGDAAGLGSSNPTVIDLYFVEIVPGFDDLPDNFANGIAFIASSGIAAHVGDNLVSSQAGREVIAQVVSHEVGHNLGLDHLDTPNNLMSEVNGNTTLTQAQINEMRESNLVRPI